MTGVEYAVDDGVARVTLLVPRVGWALMGTLSSLPARAEADGARVILLSARGPDFSHGVDLVDPQLAGQLRADGGRQVAIAGQQLVDAWAHSPLPTVVALQGRTIGAGACLAVAAEFRFAAPGSTLVFPEVARGMHLSWGILPRLVASFGIDWARWLAVGGKAVEIEALGSGAAQIVDDPRIAASRWATHLAALPPLAVKHIRAVLSEVTVGLNEAAERDAERFATTAQSADFAEAMAAWFEKRPPIFSGK